MVRRFDFFSVLLIETLDLLAIKTRFTKATHFDQTFLSILSDETYKQSPFQSIEDDQEMLYGKTI